LEVSRTAWVQAPWRFRVLRVFRWTGCLMAFVLAGGGCSGAKVTTKASEELPRYTVNRLALVPLTAIATPQAREQSQPYLSTPQSVSRSDISVSVPSNAEPLPRQTVTVPAFAAEKVTELFWNRLQKKEGLQVVAGAETAKAVGLGPDADLQTVGATVARKLNADAALVGQVRVWQERVGSRLGASPPASVGFEVKAVASDGQVLWVGNYYEQQRPMGEDLLGFIQRKGAFVTAEELAEYGVEELLEKLPFGTGRSR
jgi:hypothetical protein